MGDALLRTVSASGRYSNQSLSCAMARGFGREFEVDLDQDPEDRFTEVMRHFRAPLRSFLQQLHMEKPALKLLALELVRRRGPENPSSRPRFATLLRL